MAFDILGKKYETEAELNAVLDEGVKRYGKLFLDLIDEYRKDEARKSSFGKNYQIAELYDQETKELYDKIDAELKEKEEAIAKEKRELYKEIMG